MSAHFLVQVDASWGGASSLAGFCRQAGLVQDQGVMDELVLLTCLDHTSSAQTDRQIVSYQHISLLEKLKRTLKLQLVEQCRSPVGSELAGDAQNVHHSLQLQLSTAYRRSDEAACPANPGTVSRGAWVMESLQNNFQQ